ncbi:MAG: o-succinylbenzoate--CoA ligase [Myxococcota bacterium]
MKPWLEARAALAPDQPALTLNGVTLTFGALASRARDAALRLRALGVREGDLVATLLPNGLPFVELVHALPLCGAALMPLNVRLTPRELAFQLEDARPALLVHAGGALAENARTAAPRDLRRVAVGPCDAPLLSGVAPAARGTAALRDAIDLEATGAILYTSGTTGTPKGAELPFSSLLWSAIGSAFHLGVVPGERWLACLPLFHVGGLSILVRSVLSGSEVVVHEQFSPRDVARSLVEERVGLVSLVPLMLERLLDAWGAHPAPSTLRCVLLGGAAAPKPLVERARALGFPIASTYGLSEAASQVATLPLHEVGLRADVVGKPLFCTEIRIADESGAALPPDTPGEILVRGPTLMRGYLRRPDETARTLRGGWLHTGDVGTLDAEGFLRVLDRRADLIVSGGENVYPAEVEAILLAHPDVAEAAVIGMPDSSFGQRVAAFIVPCDSGSATDSDLERFCRERLAGYKIPRAFHRLTELPRNASGKILRRALADRFASAEAIR